MNDDELVRERIKNDSLHHLVRAHWNRIVGLEKDNEALLARAKKAEIEAERLRATVDHAALLVYEWLSAADYMRTALKDHTSADDLENYAIRLRDTITPPNKE